MATAVGLQTVFGTAVETTYGTPVTVDRWYEIVSESLVRQQEVIQSSGLRAGTRNLRRGSRRALTHRWGEGSVELEVSTRGFGRWFDVMLGGTVVSTQPDATNSPSVWLHTFEMGSLEDKSLTIQKGLRDPSGTEIETFTFHGCKVTSWEIACAVGEICKLNLNVDAEDVDTSTALAAHSYVDAGVFHFAQGDVKIDDVSVAKVMSANVSGDNSLKTDSFFFGTGGLKGQPFVDDFPAIDGSLDLEFDDPATVFDAFAADTAKKLTLEFIGPIISDDETFILRVTVPEIHFTGDTPQVGGPGVVTVSAPFEGAFDGTNQSVKIEYQTDESSI